jgi:hypothetical protein
VYRTVSIPPIGGTAQLIVLNTIDTRRVNNKLFACQGETYPTTEVKNAGHQKYHRLSHPGAIIALMMTPPSSTDRTDSLGMGDDIPIRRDARPLRGARSQCWARWVRIRRVTLLEAVCALETQAGDPDIDRRDVCVASKPSRCY